jgi:hypothetical protein
MYFIQADNLWYRYYLHLYESDKIRLYVNDDPVNPTDCVY